MQNCRPILLVTLLASLLWNCRGPEGMPGPTGAPGPTGPAGPAGPQTLALMYEVEFDLNVTNNWKSFYTFPAQDEIYLEDVVLVYLLWAQENTPNGVVDIWRLMPVTYFNIRPNSSLSINYDFSVNKVEIYAEASFPLDAQVTPFTDLLARIVVVPADYSPNGRKGKTIDYTNFEAVKAAFGLPETGLKRGKPFKKLMEDYQKRQQ